MIYSSAKRDQGLHRIGPTSVKLHLHLLYYAVHIDVVFCHGWSTRGLC